MDEFDDYVIALNGDNFVFSVGGVEVFNDIIDDAVETMTGTGLVASDVVSEYDRVKVSGFFTAGDAADTRNIERPIVIRDTAPIRQ